MGGRLQRRSRGADLRVVPMVSKAEEAAQVKRETEMLLMALAALAAAAFLVAQMTMGS